MLKRGAGGQWDGKMVYLKMYLRQVGDVQTRLGKGVTGLTAKQRQRRWRIPDQQRGVIEGRMWLRVGPDEPQEYPKYGVGGLVTGMYECDELVAIGFGARSPGEAPRPW